MNYRFIIDVIPDDSQTEYRFALESLADGKVATDIPASPIMGGCAFLMSYIAQVHPDGYETVLDMLRELAMKVRKG